MKLVILGGGGVRALMLAKSLAGQIETLGITQLVFVDNDLRKLNIFAGMAGEVIRQLNGNVAYSYTSDAEKALEDADFVITTIRVGGDKARTVDERISISHGLIGQETTGGGGFSMAMRSIPVLATYCEMIKKVAKPDVMVFNFTNPAGMVTQAMRDLGYDFVYGICDAPSGFFRQLSGLLGSPLAEMSMHVFGLNHLSYFSNVTLRGKDVTQKVIENPKLYTETDMRYFQPDFVRDMGMLLNEYLFYFYYREKAVANLANAEKTRGEQIMEINHEMLAALDGLDPAKDFDRMLRIYSNFNHKRESSYMATETSVVRNEEVVPLYDIYSPDEGGYAGVATAFIRAKLSGKSSEMVLCVPNGDTVDWLEAGDVVETSCYIGPEGARPKPLAFSLSDASVNLIRTVKLYERTAVKAILEKNSKMAVEALMVHPLINSYSLAKALFEEYRNAQKEYGAGW